MNNEMLFGLGLHTAEDLLPHANTGGNTSVTFGHTFDYNEDYSESTPINSTRDETYRNPMKALSTFLRIRDLWLRNEGKQSSHLKPADLDAIADFIYAREWGEKVASLKKGLITAGVDKTDVDKVISLMDSSAQRRELFKSIKDTEKGHLGFHKAKAIWDAMGVSTFLNKKRQDISRYLNNLPTPRRDQRFEEEKKFNFMLTKWRPSPL